MQKHQYRPHSHSGSANSHPRTHADDHMLAGADVILLNQFGLPTGMGGVVTINKNGTLYSVYLVETSDPDASSVRIQTTTGIKSVRLKT